MKVTLKVWRQQNPRQTGEFKEYTANGLNPNMSFLEMLDVVNEELTLKGEEPIAFEHDCREGICGSCSCMINGEAHGIFPQPDSVKHACQMRQWHDCLGSSYLSSAGCSTGSRIGGICW